MGLTRFPGTNTTLLPYRDTDGSYRTGLDENAKYIDRLPASDREQEKERVRGLRELAKRFYPEEYLNGRSEFYTKCSEKLGDASVAPISYLKDGDNFFNLEDPRQLIAYAYLRVHPIVAPSSQAAMTSAYSRCEFYVNDFDVEVATSYKHKSRITKAFAEIEKMTPTHRKMVARQLGFGVTDDASEESVYNKLYDYVEEANKSDKRSNLVVFEKFASMKNENLEVWDTVSQAVAHAVIRKNGNIFWRGEERLGGSEEEVVAYLTNPTNLEAYLSIQEEIKAKKAMKTV